MSVYVDKMSPVVGRHRGWKWITSCHMTADSLDELHDFAVKKLGMRRSWFQNGKFPHYDLTVGRRKKAISAGAIEADAKTIVRVALTLGETLSKER